MKAATTASVLLFLLVYVLLLGQRPLIIPDEARYCEIPREMIHSGDWIVPHLNGLRYFEKPVLGYWVIAASMLAFGENAFAARLPSALATGISALLIALLLRKAGAGRTATVLAPAAFLTCLGVFATGAFNVLDGMFSMLLTAALVLCYGWHVQRDRRKQAILMAGVGVLCGLAFLVKGLVAFAVPAVVMLPFAIWERRWKDLLKIAWLPILVAVLTALPWCIAVAMREPDFIRHFFWVEHLQRFTGTSDRQHNHSIWFFVPLVLLGTLPWNMFAASTIAGFRKGDLRQPFYRFLVCWFVFPFVFFSLSKGKLGTYILPCYPPLVMLMIIGLVNYLESGRVRVFNLGAIIAACLAGLGAVFVAANQTILPFGLTIFAPSETWRCALAVAGLVAWTLLPIAAAKARDYRKKLFLFCAGPVPILMLVPFIYPAEHYQEHAPEPFLRKYADRIGPTTILVSDNTLVHAICWVYRREDVNILTGRTGELEYGLSYDDARHRLLDLDGLLDLIGKQSGQRRVTMILPSSVRETYLRYLRLTGMAGRLPAPRFEATENGLWVGEFGGDQSAEEPLPSLVPVRNKED